jgi:hypothetical protein
MRLLTDGRGLFVRTSQGHIFDLLVDPTQPLVTGEGLPLVEVTGRVQRRRRASPRSGKPTKARRRTSPKAAPRS